MSAEQVMLGRQKQTRLLFAPKSLFLRTVGRRTDPKHESKLKIDYKLRNY